MKTERTEENERNENTNPDKRPIGRPTKYKPEYAEEAYRQCLLGKTDKDLALHFGVAESTIHEWKNNFPEFSESVRAGKDKADGDVAYSLYRRAMGFTYEEVTFEKIDSKTALENDTNEDLQTEVYKKKVVTKLVVPDTGAAMNWLKNRQKELWRDNMEIDFNKLTDEQLDKIIERLTNKANGQL